MLKENYGKADDDCVKRVKCLYNKLGLNDAYKAYELEQYSNLNDKISNIKIVNKLELTNKLKQLLNLYVKKIFKRSS